MLETKEYFKRSYIIELQWNQHAVFPLPRFSMNRLVALESDEGFLIALGIVIDIDRQRKTVLVKTPLDNISKVNAIRIGNIDIDPETYFNRQIQ